MRKDAWELALWVVFMVVMPVALMLGFALGVVVLVNVVQWLT